MSNSRQKEILEILYQKGRASVSELARTLYVTEMTIRRDLDEMEKSGFLRRYRGGAVLKINQGEMPITQRLLLDKDEKELLAKKCEPFLHDGMTVFIDSSSTCQYLLPHLALKKGITVVTNSVKALLSAGELHLPCILIGGEYYAYTASTAHYSAIVGLTSGVDAVAILSGVNAPTVARNGYYQTHALYQTTGVINCRDLISALTLNVVSGQSNVQGTIAKSKAGLM